MQTLVINVNISSVAVYNRAYSLILYFDFLLHILIISTVFEAINYEIYTSLKQDLHIAIF